MRARERGREEERERGKERVKGRERERASERASERERKREGDGQRNLVGGSIFSIRIQDFHRKNTTSRMKVFLPVLQPSGMYICRCTCTHTNSHIYVRSLHRESIHMNETCHAYR